MPLLNDILVILKRSEGRLTAPTVGRIMRRQIIYTAIVAVLLVAAMVATRHIDQLNDGIKLKKIELKDNSIQLDILDKKYSDLNEQLNQKDADKQKIEQQLQELQKERDALQEQLQAKIEQKKRDIASRAQKAVTGAINTPKAYASSTCSELANKMSALGIVGGELSAAITLAQRESSCNSNAVNKTSGACGEFQSYPCGKWGTPGTTEYLTNAIRYTQNRYGSYQAALAHSYANNWY